MPTTHLTLQRVVLPDLTVCSEFDLYLRQTGPVAPNLQTGEIGFEPGGVAEFNTYMNLFSLSNWERHCDLKGLSVCVAGEGRFHIRIWRVTEDLLSKSSLYEGQLTLSPIGQHVDLSGALGPSDGPHHDALIGVEFEAITTGAITDARFMSPQPENVTPDAPDLRLAISITTFRREEEVARTAERISTFLDGPCAEILEAAGAEAHLFVVDNGQSAEIEPHPSISFIPNANLGGAGGFARGLAAAQDGEFTHCLFMDDDASFEMENLVRTLAFLRLARTPDMAVAGAMIVNSRKWMMWENGAVFDRSCHPKFSGTDLRNLQDVACMEIAASREKPGNFYGGWWYFAFPISHVERYPFPFFVRGDDISFSLANPFRIATINGVVSFQDDFSAKESALTLYLDLRNHLHHHLTHEALNIGASATTRIFWRFFIRSIIRLHYETAEAQIIAMEDVMKGPGFFDGNADMMAKRPEILGLIKDEKWQDVDPHNIAPPLPYHPPGRWKTRLLKFTLNGHLLPGWGARSKERRILLRDRGLIWPMWGVTRADFVDYDNQKAYTVRYDRARFTTLMRRAIRQSRAFRRAYPELRAAYSTAYPQTTQRSFWQKLFLSPSQD